MSSKALLRKLGRPVAGCLCLLVLGCFSLTHPERVALAAQAQSSLPAGIELPRRGVVYALETTPSGAQLVQLHSAEIKLNSHTGSNFARGMVYAGPRSTAELAGLNAEVHLHSAGLAFLIRLGEDDAERTKEGLAVLRMKQTEKGRVVSTFSANVFGAQHKRQYDQLAVTKVELEEGTWLKVTPAQPLEPGEYGLTFVPKDPNLMPGSIYDFDVDFDTAKPDQK